MGLVVYNEKDCLCLLSSPFLQMVQLLGFASLPRFLPTSFACSAVSCKTYFTKNLQCHKCVVFFPKYGLCAHWPQKKHGISGGTGTILLRSQSRQRNPCLPPVHQLTASQSDKSLARKKRKIVTRAEIVRSREVCPLCPASPPAHWPMNPLAGRIRTLTPQEF